MMEPPLTEIEGFEPQTRARSNTWPLPRPENYVDVDVKEENGKCTPHIESGCVNVIGPHLDGSLLGVQLPAPGAKKNSSRRNAWGNLSYADLITQAIASVPEKRLTLSQIYEWMVQNVPYFKDKGDSNSSAGWKNSIRHNLSLHNRFMRVQNEGTGKSSWWMINPDAKPGKSSRRRATSMETSKFEKRRGRVKKKVEALRNGLITADATPSPSSSVSEGLDMFPDSPLHQTTGFQLSPDFRPRASSNASSCGRLSPIPFSESEWNSPTSYPSGYVSEQLAGNLAEGMKIHHEAFLSGGYTSNGGAPPPPPPYQPPFENFGSRLGSHAASPYGISQCPVHRLQGCSCALSQCARESLSPAGLSPSYPQSEPSPDPMSGSQPPYPRRSSISTPRIRSTPSTMMGQLMGALNNSTVLDDLNLNIETFHGGFDCNVDEVIKHELSMDGSLDFNFSHNQTSLSGGQTVTDSSNTQPASTYSTTVSVTGPSWVH